MNKANITNKKQLYKKIFFSTLYLSTFTFGGGYVIITLLKQKFVDDLHWIDEDEMLNLVSIAQSAPGAIAVNGSIVVGYKLGGISGILFAVLGSILPPMVILTIISSFYNFFIGNIYVASVLNGMKAGVSAVIVSVVFDMISDQLHKRQWCNLLLIVICFSLTYFYSVNILFIILGTIAIGIIRTVILIKKEEAESI